MHINSEVQNMAFGISENTTSYFTNNKLDFPRFQRKPTWKEKDNFRLCISVFKGYPIGVVIVNEMSREGKKYLLDGRQRRQALLDMYRNPNMLYAWAVKFIGIKPRDTREEVIDKFNKAIHSYLQSEFEKAASEAVDSAEAVEEVDIDYTLDVESPTFDPDTQSANMKALIELILMVHGGRGKTTKFQNMFMFDKKIPIEELDYSGIDNAEYYIDPIKLKRYIKDRIDNDEISFNDFTNHIKKRYKLDDKEHNKVKQYIESHWDYYKNCFETIQKTDEIIINAKIGLIRLINASPLDAQNIFSLINSNGVKLTAEELLSSRPFWNVTINHPSDEVRLKTRELYNALEITLPKDVVRWDLCATVMDRIDSDQIVFDKNTFKNKNKKDTSGFTRKLTMGFKMISALKVGGINSNSVKELEEANVNWETDIEEIIKNYSIIFSLLADCEYFKYMKAWNQSVMSLTSNTVALEFAALIYNKWIQLGKPMRINTSKVKEFHKCCVILYDRLVYEYSNRLWAGSSDSRLARDLENQDNRFKVISFDEWKNVIDIFKSGENSSVSKAILYHFYCIRQMTPTLKSSKTRYEKDHIYAQSKFDGSSIVNKGLMNSLGNFALLPKDENIDKSDKAINELAKGSWLYNQVLKYTDIQESDVDKFSNISNLEELIEYRINIFYDVFNQKRTDLINNC